MDCDSRLEHLEHAVFGNGREGMLACVARIDSRLDVLMAQLDTREKERDRYRKEREVYEDRRFKREKENAARVGIMLTILLVLIGSISLYITYREMTNHSMFPALSTSSQLDAKRNSAYAPYLPANGGRP